MSFFNTYSKPQTSNNNSNPSTQTIKIQKNNKTYFLTQHSILRNIQRSQLSQSSLQQSFQQSILINQNNIHKFPQFQSKFTNISKSHKQSSTHLFYNPIQKIQFRIDTFNNNICTLIKF